MSDIHGTITEVLSRMRSGDEAASEELLSLVYHQLKQMALGRVRGQSQSIDATELVHEAYVKLFGVSETHFQNRRHFFFAAARAMRNVLVEQARRRHAVKRGGDITHISMQNDMLAVQDAGEFLDLTIAIEKLGAKYSRVKDVVMLEFFAGLSHEETAEIMNTSRATVRRDWAFARAWLKKELECDRKR